MDAADRSNIGKVMAALKLLRLASTGSWHLLLCEVGDGR